MDYVLNGAIASTLVYGALLNANVETLESALGLLITHYIPYRSSRYGHYSAAAAFASEVAIMSV